MPTDKGSRTFNVEAESWNGPSLVSKGVTMPPQPQTGREPTWLQASVTQARLSATVQSAEQPHHLEWKDDHGPIWGNALGLIDGKGNVYASPDWQAITTAPISYFFAPAQQPKKARAFDTAAKPWEGPEQSANPAVAAQAQLQAGAAQAQLQAGAAQAQLQAGAAQAQLQAGAAQARLQTDVAQAQLRAIVAQASLKTAGYSF